MARKKPGMPVDERASDTPPRLVPAMPAHGPAQGWLEMISKDACAIGWAWYPQAPDARVEVEFLIDGQVMGSAVAGLYRADVAAAGIGSGCYGFSWPLPSELLAQAKDLTVVARERATGTALPEPRLFRQRAVADAMTRLTELEADIRLLSGTIAALEQRKGEDERAARALFNSVGRFFSDLAAGAAPPRALRTAVADVIGGLPPFALPYSAAPEVTVFVEAAGAAEAVHGALLALAGSLEGGGADVFLLDTGRCEDAVLLPSVVRHLRYARLGAGAVARVNDALRLAAAPVVVFLAGGLSPLPGWAEALAAFGQRAGLAALAGRLSGPDGALRGAGASVQEGLVRPRRGDTPGVPEAVDAALFAIRRAAWAQLGGLDEGFSGLGPALAAFCLRARAAGHEIGFEPGFGATGDALEALAADVQAEGEDARRLRAVVEGFSQVAA